MALAAMFFCAPARTQPLLLIGKADAELSGAFSYDFLKSPLGRPLHGAQAQISLNLPINASAQAQRLLGSMADSAVVMPEIFTRVSQHMNAQVDVSAPLFGGVFFFAARENASLRVAGALGDTRFNLDTALEAGAVLLKGSIHMPLVFDLYWRSLTFGYAFRPTPRVAVGFQVHKHLFGARTSGDLRPDLAGRISVSGDANTSFLVEYPDSKVYGRAEGGYYGEAWSPEMGLALGPFRLVSRMGARMAAKGKLDVAYSVPFFIDPENFQPRFSEPDSFLATENLRRLLDGETGSKVLHVRDRLIVNLPQSHTLSWEILPGRNAGPDRRLSLHYTRVLGHLSLHGESYRGAPDSNQVDTRGYLDLDVFPDHVLCLAGRFAWFHGNLGLHSLNVSYPGQGHLLSGLSPFEWDGDPMVPILNFGFTWGAPMEFALDVHVTPLPAVRTGVTYGF